MRRSLPWRSFILALVAVGLVAWLALSESPADRRAARINAAIAAGLLGKLSPALQQQLEEQVRWLARHAAVKQPVAVNKPIAAGQLTVVVTDPAYANLTGCGRGNAVYDPALDAIFIDEALVWPIELAALGERSAHSMSDVGTFGFVVSYVNVILAHELGHRQLHRKAAAFFSYSLTAGGGDFRQEQEADRFAVEMISRGYLSGDVPDLMARLNALEAVGLSFAGTAVADRAAGDIIGAMILMSQALLFSSSPYSPFHFDKQHPSFLDRTAAAIAASGTDRLGETLGAHVPVLKEQIRRVAEMGGWRNLELLAPAPITTVAVRSGSLWLGTRDVPRNARAPIDEFLFRVDLADLRPADTPTTRSLAKADAVASGRSPEDHLPGAWVEALVSDGSTSVGLPPDPQPDQPVQERDFGPGGQWGELVYKGPAWRWVDQVTGPVRLGEADLKERATTLLGYQDLGIGNLQYCADGVAVPVVEPNEAGGSTFRVLHLRSNGEGLREEAGFAFARADGTIDVTGAVAWRGAWWVPIRPATARGTRNWEMWRLGADGSRDLIAQAPLLVSLTGEKAAGIYRRDLAPYNAKTAIVSGDRFVFGYDIDSLFVIDPIARSSAVLFHPADKGLRLVDLGDGRVMIWMLNGQKVFVVDVGSRRPVDDQAQSILRRALGWVRFLF